MNPQNFRSFASVNKATLQRRHKPDYVLLVVCALLLTLGLIVVYSIGPAIGSYNNVGENYYISRQIVAVLLSIITFFVVANMPLKVWQKLEKPLLITALVTSLAVRLFGEEINGAYRWIQVGGLSFQAAELIKFALLIWLAGFLSRLLINKKIRNTKESLGPLSVALLAIGLIVAVLQSDFGSAFVMVVMMGAMVLAAGIPLKRLLLIGLVIVVGSFFAIVTSEYRMQRLQTFLQPASAMDCQGAGYQACQALIAVGSGGVFGLGLAKSVQAYGYLPEAANDSIFAIFAEKFGFLGSAVLIGLFVILFARILKVIERAPNDYSRLLAVGVLAWLSTQAMINIGAMIGLLPIKGITLPFISYGGTSLLFVAAAVALVFNISRYTKHERVVSRKRRREERLSPYDDITSRRRVSRSYYSAISRST